MKHTCDKSAGSEIRLRNWSDWDTAKFKWVWHDLRHCKDKTSMGKVSTEDKKIASREYYSYYCHKSVVVGS